MKTTLPPLPVSEEVFRTIIRLHEQRRTYAEIGTVVGMSAQEVEDLRWKHLDRWLKERTTIAKAVRSDFVMEVVARIQLVLSVTSNPKDIALLAKAMESILKHDPNYKARPSHSPKREPATPAAPANTPTRPEEAIASTPPPEGPVELTQAELITLQTLRDQSPTNTELLYKMQQAPTLYEKCLKIGRLPQIEKPEPSPTPPAKRSWASKLFAGLVYVLMGTTAFLGSYRLRTYLDEPTPTTNVRVQAHPPNH